MIIYEEGCLGISPDLLFRVRGSVVPKSLLWAVPAAACSVGLFVVWGGGDSEATGSVSQAWLSYSSILGILICLRMQLAYNRYWEACSRMNVMRGEWLDAFMSSCSFCSRLKEKEEEVADFKSLLMRLFSLLHHAAVTKLELARACEVPVINLAGLEKEHLRFCVGHPDRVDIVVVWIEQVVAHAARSGVIRVEPPILTRVFNELSRGVVEFKHVMKIRTYEFPFPIAQMIQYLMMFHVLVSPIVASLAMYNWRWAAMLSFSSVFCLWCINYIAMEIEQPFNTGHNNLPVLQMQRDVNELLLLATDRRMWRPPWFEQGCTRRFSQGAPEVPASEVVRAGLFSTDAAAEGDRQEDHDDCRSDEAAHHRPSPPHRPAAQPGRAPSCQAIVIGI